MSTETAAIDTREREYPKDATQPTPTLGRTAAVWLRLAVPTALANLVVLAAATALGAEMTAEVGFEQSIGPAAIVTASLGTLFISTFVWSVVAHRVPAFAHLWVPIGWGVGLVSLGGILGAAGIATGVALAVMHLLTTAVAAHLIPRSLPH